MPKRRSGGRDGRRAAKVRRQHLYLVFDDWSCGYSIRKLDVSDDSAEPSDLKVSVKGAELRLPPAVFRWEARRGLPHYFASAFGTRIMALHPREHGADGKMPFGTVYDVRSRGIIFGPRSKANTSHPIYIPVDDRLFSVAAGSFELLGPPPLELPGGQHSVWSWCELPRPPFERQHVTSYAVHPDGRTIVVSTKTGTTATTFTLDTEAPFFVWRRLGEWTLPFAGRAHFDCELDAFVGLSEDPDTLGQLYSCDAWPVSSEAGGVQCPAPAQKLSKEKLFSEDQAEEIHVGATLVYMGSPSRFCLVQCISIEDDCDDEELKEKDAPRPCRHLFRLTMFSLSYDKNGDLTTGKSRRVRYCKVPKGCTEFLLKNPVAFWM